MAVCITLGSIWRIGAGGYAWGSWNVLRKWIRDATVGPQHAFPGQGVMRSEQAQLERLRKENAKLRMERDLLKKAAAYFAKESM
jgi:transposase